MWLRGMVLLPLKGVAVMVKLNTWSASWTTLAITPTYVESSLADWIVKNTTNVETAYEWDASNTESAIYGDYPADY